VFADGSKDTLGAQLPTPLAAKTPADQSAASATQTDAVATASALPRTATRLEPLPRLGDPSGAQRLGDSA
jgi:hypothetical protein